MDLIFKDVDVSKFFADIPLLGENDPSMGRWFRGPPVPDKDVIFHMFRSCSLAVYHGVRAAGKRDEGIGAIQV